MNIIEKQEQMELKEHKNKLKKIMHILNIDKTQHDFPKHLLFINLKVERFWLTILISWN